MMADRTACVTVWMRNRRFVTVLMTDGSGLLVAAGWPQLLGQRKSCCRVQQEEKGKNFRDWSHCCNIRSQHKQKVAMMDAMSL